MRPVDATTLSLSAITNYPLRSALTALGIAIGVSAVILLTAISGGLQRFVLAEFTQFGTNLIGISPGKTTTTGVSGGVIGNIRPLSLDDADALRQIPQVIDIVPVTQGNAEVEFGQRSRHVMVMGAGAAAPQVWKFNVFMGKFLPADDPVNARPFAVLGHKLYTELFKGKNPLGKLIRVGGFRYRVVGVMEPKGQLLGFDLDDAIYIPAARALEMFNRDSLMEIDVLYTPGADAQKLSDRIHKLLLTRHGSEDFTIVTQEQMLETLDNILDILTLAVAAIGAISLLVGGIGILTIMTIAVNERTNEIGLLRALGSTRRQISLLFLGEALTLSAIGGVAGLILGGGAAVIVNWVIPALPTHLSFDYIVLAEGVAISIGLIAGVFPARRAAGLDPVEALRAE
jgi:putative ABC transport system permease protein